MLKPYIDAGEIDNKNDEPIYFDKSRTSLILNRHEDVPNALRNALGNQNIGLWIYANFDDFMSGYINSDDINSAIEEISSMIESDANIKDKSRLLGKKQNITEFLADVLVL